MLIRIAKNTGFKPELLNAVEKRNALQKTLLASKIITRFGTDLSGKQFCLWGLSFKPGTDDIREASSREIIRELINAGASLKAFDPVAMNQARKEFPQGWFDSGKLVLSPEQYPAAKNADALILVTEWKSFRQPDFSLLASTMKNKIIFDGRNQYHPDELSEMGFEYHGMGRENYMQANQCL